MEGLICHKLGLDKSKLDVVDRKVEDNAINKKQNGVRGEALKFLTNFYHCVKFLLNHHRNIVIPKSFGGNTDWGGAIPPTIPPPLQAPKVATALTYLLYVICNQCDLKNFKTRLFARAEI